MKKKISIITSFPISIPHPRVELEKKALVEAGFEVRVFSFPEKPVYLERLWNYLSLNNYKKHVFKEVTNSISDEDLIILYDYALLPTVLSIKKKKKKVIYESIDNMVHLNFHEIERHFPVSRLFKNLFISYYSSKEKKWAAACNGVIVNSKSLVKYFHPVKSTLNYYCSPFESASIITEYPADAALLYLGLLSKDKGAMEMLDLQKLLEIPLYIMGDIRDESLKDRILENEQVFWKPRQSPAELKEFLDRLRSKYRLLGCSIIHPIHYSYATQEANKDQDYLALGIPIIGNTRIPTFEKIQAGCGLLHTDIDGIKALKINIELYKSLSAKCLEYYRVNYSYEEFRAILLDEVHKCLGQLT